MSTHNLEKETKISQLLMFSVMCFIADIGGRAV